MCRSVSKFLVCGFCVLVATFPGRAARDVTAKARQSSYEIVVLEVAQCIYCKLFRRDVVPTYNASSRSKTIPMRFVDLDHGSLSAFQLTAPIETVPTVVLLHKRQEVGRLAGHVGPETFVHAINRMLSAAP